MLLVILSINKLSVHFTKKNCKKQKKKRKKKKKKKKKKTRKEFRIEKII